MTTINLFQNSKDWQPFTAGQTIFAEGQPGHTMYVVKVGQVEIKVGDKQVGIVEAGSIIGEMALIEPGLPRSATAVALVDCELVEIDERSFNFMVQQTPYFALQVMQIMANRLRRMDSQFK